MASFSRIYGNDAPSLVVLKLPQRIGDYSTDKEHGGLDVMDGDDRNQLSSANRSSQSASAPLNQQPESFL